MREQTWFTFAYASPLLATNVASGSEIFLSVLQWTFVINPPMTHLPNRGEKSR